MNNSEKKLKNLKDQLNSINMIIETIDSEINSLEQNEQVKAYLKAKDQMSRLITEHSNISMDIKRLIQDDCNHPLYYYMGEVENHKDYPAILEHPTLIRCVCIKCGEEVIDNISAFAGKLIDVNNYEGYVSLRREFESLENTDLNEKQKVLFLLNKYNSRIVDKIKLMIKRN